MIEENMNNDIYPIASVWKRFAAFSIDTLIVLPFYMIIVLILNKIDLNIGINQEVLSNFLYNPMFLVFILFGWIHFKGQSIGQKIIKIKIVKMDNSNIDYKNALLRVVGWFACNITLGIGFLIMFLNKDKRGLHDFTSNSKVIDISNGEQIF